MVRRLLNKIKSSGHGDFEVAQATLQSFGLNDALLAMPTRVGEAQIHLAGSENGRKRLGRAGPAEIWPDQRLKRTPSRIFSPDRTRHACKPLRPPSRHGIESQIVKHLIQVPFEFPTLGLP